MDEPRTNKPLHGPERKTITPLLIVLAVLALAIVIILLPVLG